MKEFNLKMTKSFCEFSKISKTENWKSLKLSSKKQIVNKIENHGHLEANLYRVEYLSLESLMKC